MQLHPGLSAEGLDVPFWIWVRVRVVLHLGQCTLTHIVDQRTPPSDLSIYSAPLKEDLGNVRLKCYVSQDLSPTIQAVPLLGHLRRFPKESLSALYLKPSFLSIVVQRAGN